MKLSRFNFLCALVSFACACIWLAIGQSVSGIIWLICSVFWLTLSVAHRGASAAEPNPARRLVRRLSHLLLWS